MMPIHFEGANAIYGKPKNMTDEECQSVSAYECKNEKGDIVSVTTVWQPNKEDIEAFNAGRPVYVTVHGPGMPPIALCTLDENGQANV